MPPVPLGGSDLEDLVALGFDPAGFERVWRDHVSGLWKRDLVIAPVRLAPPPMGAFVPLPPRSTAERERLASIGTDAISRGRVGVIVLNGGMATRFGGVVKGMVEALPGRSFLDLKISQVRAVGRDVPVFLMDSPATHAPTLEHLAGLDQARSGVFTFLQQVGPRITPDGEAFRGEDGRVSWSGMGHGDVLQAFRRSWLGEFRERGGRIVMVGNVDNLGACLDPAMVGLHLELGRPVTVEVAARTATDTGGLAVLIGGRLALLEGLRWPRALDDSAYLAFNTNTFHIDVEVFEDPPRLDAYPVEKEVSGRVAVQFERILGEVTHHVATSFVLVPAAGGESRFVPVKRREDLGKLAGVIERVLGAWGVT